MITGINNAPLLLSTAGLRPTITVMSPDQYRDWLGNSALSRIELSDREADTLAYHVGHFIPAREADFDSFVQTVIDNGNQLLTPALFEFLMSDIFVARATGPDHRQAFHEFVDYITALSNPDERARIIHPSFRPRFHIKAVFNRTGFDPRHFSEHYRNADTRNFYEGDQTIFNPTARRGPSWWHFAETPSILDVLGHKVRARDVAKDPEEAHKSPDHGPARREIWVDIGVGSPLPPMELDDPLNAYTLFDPDQTIHARWFGLSGHHTGTAPTNRRDVTHAVGACNTGPYLPKILDPEKIARLFDKIGKETGIRDLDPEDLGRADARTSSDSKEGFHPFIKEPQGFAGADALLYGGLGVFAEGTRHPTYDRSAEGQSPFAFPNGGRVPMYFRDVIETTGETTSVTTKPLKSAPPPKK